MMNLDEIASASFELAAGIAIGLAIVSAFVILGLFLIFAGTRLWPFRIEKLDAGVDLSPDEMAAAEELTHLGFVRVGAALLERGTTRNTILSFRHKELPAFAALILLRDVRVGFPVIFYSADARDRLLVTTNRRDWMFPVKLPTAILADPYAANLADHWKAHEARLSNEAPVPTSDADAQKRAFQAAEDYFKLLQQKGFVVEGDAFWRATKRTAFWQTRTYLPKVRKFISSYTCAAMNGEHQDLYDVAAYEEMEAKLASQTASSKTKTRLLIISALTSLPLWGVTLGWDLALPIMIILAVHEAGHAIAMWAFGYRNISVMFVPLLGALVTANPKEIPVWKQAIMLLAGPVPGFVAGVAALLYLKEHPLNAWGVPWTKVAVWAAVINLLNLLPINPLDGGKVFDIALFSRWPRARLVFVALSSIVIFSYSVWAESYILLIVGAFLLGGVYTQRRIMTLQLAWQEGLSRRDQLKNLFHAARVSLKNPSFATILPAVKAVFTLRNVQKPRLWETIAAISAMLVLWSSAATGFYVFKQKPDTSVVSSTQLMTHSNAIWPCKNEADPFKAARICMELLAKGQLDKASQIMAYDKLAETALIGSDYKTSLAWSKKAIKTNPGFPYHYLLAGRASAGLRQFDQAIGNYDAAIRALPAFFQAFHQRGEAYLALGDRERARKDFETALSLNKDYKPAQIAIAQLR